MMTKVNNIVLLILKVLGKILKFLFLVKEKNLQLCMLTDIN